MAVSTASIPKPRQTNPSRAGVALAIADANWFSTESLFRALDEPGTSTLLLKCVDFVNAWQRGQRPWNRPSRANADAPRLTQKSFVLPSGWMKTYPAIGMRPLARAIDGWRSAQLDRELTLVMTYPHYLYLRDQVRPNRTVYYNIDDYSQYWPRRAARINQLERQAVLDSDCTICVSRARAEALRLAVPVAAERIHHLPHGTPSHMLSETAHHLPAAPPPDLFQLPRPLLGFVGSLEDRVDWGLLTQLATAIPSASVVLIGNLSQARRGPWMKTRQGCLELPNVHAIGWRNQAELRSYHEAFDVCLIPYLAAHPFNQVCCPTKIMDFMGTGRPIVATSLPECELYGRLFDVVDTSERFIAAVKRIVANGSDDGRADDRHAWSRANTCREVARRLIELAHA